MRLNANCRLLFVGDSITDCGRSRPIGNGGTEGALGSGYVSLVHAALTAAYPALAIETMNTGVSGDTVRDLAARWDTDVSSLHPDWLSVMIGINDVWRQFDGLWAKEQFISQDEYKDTLQRLVASIRRQVRGLVLMSPYYLETSRTDAMRRMMDAYGAVAAKTARLHDAIFVDTQAVFDGLMQHIPPQQLAADRVHVGLVGHTALCRAFLQGIGFEKPDAG